jgi:hypothetical protein
MRKSRSVHRAVWSSGQTTRLYGQWWYCECHRSTKNRRLVTFDDDEVTCRKCFRYVMIRWGRQAERGYPKRGRFVKHGRAIA